MMERLAQWWRGLRLPFFMALRYLVSRRRVGAANIISAISALGVAFGTAALICTLSVFNGFHDLVGGLLTNFDPQLMIEPAKGKFAAADDPALARVMNMAEVESASACLEDNALILFRGRPLVITIKGVDEHYDKVTDIRSILYGEGSYRLRTADVHYGIPGIGLASMMGGIDYGTLQICAPRKGERVNLVNPAESFNADDLTSAGVCFDVNQRKYNENYLLCSLDFAQNLFEQDGRITSLELILKPSADTQKVKTRMQSQLGADFKVLDRMEQHHDMFNVMKIEKMVSYLFLTFILLVACFNIIGSMSMLIIEKRKDMQTLRNLGATPHLVFRIFLMEGRFVALLGAVVGLALGLLLCWLQQTYGLIRLGGSSGDFIIDAYPVSVYPLDVLLVAVTVIVVGFASVWVSVKYLANRLL